ncbi:MAG: SPOR domain-containing protein [Gemmatimonadota bacterium]
MTRDLRHSIGTLAAVATLAATTSCDRTPSRPAASGAGAEESRGAALVVGSTADEWGLLVLPRSGGTATLRGLSVPEQVVWEGTASLPAFVEAHRVSASAVVLRSPDGAVHLYDPARDALDSLGTLTGDSVAWAEGEEGGAFVAPAAGEILAVTREGSWRVQNGGPVLWAATVHDGVVVLSPADGGSSLRFQPRATTSAAPGTPLPVGPPGVVTAWGRRAALVESPGSRAIRILTVDPFETTGRVELDGPVTALAASPSSHELYAGLSDPARVDVVNRFSFTARRLARFRTAVRAIRPSLFGESLLVFDGTAIWRVPIAGSAPEPVPGAWGGDLPLGLPDGTVLTRTEDGVARLAPGADGVAPVDGKTDGWWVAVRWKPVPRLVAAEAEPAGVPVRPGRAGAERVDEPEAPTETPDAVEGPPSGYYAIVGSVRQREGIEGLVGELAGAGYPVRIQSVPDQAGETWYRGLVGPYSTRAEAEAAARQLQRERRLQSWVTGIGFDG